MHRVESRRAAVVRLSGVYICVYVFGFRTKERLQNVLRKQREGKRRDLFSNKEELGGREKKTREGRQRKRTIKKKQKKKEEGRTHGEGGWGGRGKGEKEEVLLVVVKRGEEEGREEQEKKRQRAKKNARLRKQEVDQCKKNKYLETYRYREADLMLFSGAMEWEPCDRLLTEARLLL